MKNIDIENTFSLLQFKASSDYKGKIIPLVGYTSCGRLKGGDLFLGNYNENNHHYYGYYVMTDDSGTFYKVKEPLILPVEDVAELRYDKVKNNTNEEPKLKVPYSAISWCIGVFYWIKSELGFHAAKLFKDEFLNGIEEYQTRSDGETE